MTRVTVIGAGVGGLACGALLAKSGYEVRVLERNSFIGGRCSSSEHGGFTIDNFVHAFPMGSKGPHGRISRLLGEEITFVAQDPAATVVDGRRGRMNSFPQSLDILPLMTRYRMARDIGVKAGSLWGGFRLFRDLLNADEAFVESHDEQTLDTFLYRYTDDMQLHRFFDLLAWMMFVVPYNEASAGEFIWCFREMFRSAAFGYVKGSTGAIPAAYRRGLEKFGGVVELDSPADGITSEGGKVTGVIAGGREIPSDVVVSDAGISTTVKLAGEEALGADFVRSADGLKYSYGGVVIKYILDRPVLDMPYMVYIADSEDPKDVNEFLANGEVPPDAGIFMPVIDRCDPDLVPQGRQLLIAATFAPASPTEDVARGLLDLLEKRLFSIYPEVEKHVVEKLEVVPGDISRATGRPESGDVIGIAQIPGQVGKKKPSPVTPIDGLYLVGCDAGARGIGTEQAAGSAEAVSALIHERYPEHDPKA